MSGIKARIELFFEDYARLLYAHRVKTLLLVFLVIGAILYKLPALTVDTNSEALLRDSDPSKIVYNQFRDQFGQDRMIVIAITAENLFSEDFFTRLRSLHRDLEERVPYVDEVTSLINARNTRGEDDRLIVEDLLERWPRERSVDFDRLKQQVMNNPAFLDQIISADGRTTAVVVKPNVYQTRAAETEDALADFGDDSFAGEIAPAEKPHYLSEKESEELVAAVNSIVEEYEKPDFAMAYAGAPAVMSVFNKYTMKDLRLCFLLSFIVAMIFLAVLFRRASGVILPQIVVNAASFSALGLMGWFGVPVKMTTTVLPAFLLCVGVADSVHILSIFYRQVDEGQGKADAIAYAMGHSGLAVTLTTLTTAAALLSFSFAELTAMGELGLFAAAGVVLALFYTITMLPALIAFVPVRRKPGRTSQDGTLMDRTLLMTAGFSTRYPVRIIIVSLILFAICFHFMFNLRYSDHVVNYFPKTLPIRNDIDYIDRHLNGALNVEIIIDTGRENGLYEPVMLNRIERLAHDLETMRFPDIAVGKVTSINHILKETNQALHDNDPDFYTIPRDYNTIAQEFLLFENAGAEELETIVDSQFSRTRVTAKVHWVDSVYLDEFINSVKTYVDGLFQDTATVQITGMSALMARTISAALSSMTKSYILAFGVIAVMMILLVGDVKTGLFSMIPNILPIILTLGIMGALDVPMDLTSLMIASIAMGLVVDDTVHFIYNFRKYYLKSGNAFAAVNQTMTGVGRALLITTIVLSCGFFVTIFATLSHTFRFGIFTGITILFALLADFILAPALMVIITGSHKDARAKRAG
ncbi:MAG: efflux RND transporter permease subunit [Desulfosudaceae bacterium]